jgi:hypothetical protein
MVGQPMQERCASCGHCLVWLPSSLDRGAAPTDDILEPDEGSGFGCLRCVARVRLRDQAELIAAYRDLVRALERSHGWGEGPHGGHPEVDAARERLRLAEALFEGRDDV